MPRTIHEVLKNWGREQRQSPVRNDALKSEILARFKSDVSGELDSAPRRFPWLSLAFGSLAVLIFFLNSSPIQRIGPVPQSFLPESKTSTGGFALPNTSKMLPDYYPYSGTGAPITDNREFLKTDYSATLRSRDISGLTGRVETTVRGFGGRVDGSSRAEKYGYVSFAIPANRLESFRGEIKSLVWEKFYTEQSSSQNLLPQKQSIEEQQTQAENTLAGYESDRQNLIANHNRRVASIQARLKAIAQAEPKTPELEAEENSLKNNLSSENASYKSKLAAIDAQIKAAQDNIESIKKQDQNLLDNVATVQGYISITWISLWEALDLYVPGSLLGWLFLLAGLGAYHWNRRQSQIIF